MVTGHVRKRSSKSGESVYQLIIESERDPITGKRQRQYKTVRANKKQAEAILRKMLEEVNVGGVLNQSSVKLSAWFDEWMKLYLPNIAETTRAGYEESIKTRINPYIGNIPLNRLNAPTIQGWINELYNVKKLSPKTIKNSFLILRAALEKATVLKMLSANPCIGIVLPKLIKPKVECYNKPEIIQMLSAAKGTDMYLPLILTVSAGVRRGELLALRWQDVDFEKSIIHIVNNSVLAGGKNITKDPKSESGKRDIYIGKKTLEVLKEGYAKYQADKEEQGLSFHDTDLVVRQHNGKAYRPDSYTQKWERFVKANGLKVMKFHGLRHTNATALYSAGIDGKVIQERLGHADISITYNTYTHSVESLNKEAGDKLDEIIFGN